MIRLSHTQLESARRDPRAFRTQIGMGGTATRYSPSRKRYLIWAIGRYHSHGLAAAEQYIRTHFARRAFTAKSLAEYTSYLHTYDIEYRRRASTVLEIIGRDRITFSLTSGVVLGGEIGRIDLTADGYYVWIFEVRSFHWQRELRMPLIQRYYTKHFGAPTREVSVGFYFLQDGVYETKSFTDREISRAMREAASLAAYLASA